MKNECPLENVINQANISTIKKDANDKAYTDMTNLNWKYRYHNHQQSFKNPT